MRSIQRDARRVWSPNKVQDVADQGIATEQIGRVDAPSGDSAKPLRDRRAPP